MSNDQTGPTVLEKILSICERGSNVEQVTWFLRTHSFFLTIYTPFIQIQQTRKGLPNADINNYVSGIHKVGKYQHIAFKLFLYKMSLCRADAKWFILRMVRYHNKRFV